MMTKKTLYAFFCALGLSFSAQANDLTSANNLAQTDDAFCTIDIIVPAIDSDDCYNDDGTPKQIEKESTILHKKALDYVNNGGLRLQYLNNMVAHANRYLLYSPETFNAVNEIITFRPNGYFAELYELKTKSNAEVRTFLCNTFNEEGEPFLQNIRDIITREQYLASVIDPVDFKALLYATVKLFAEALIRFPEESDSEMQRITYYFSQYVCGIEGLSEHVLYVSCIN